MRNEMGKMLKETVSRAAVEVAIKTIKMPNQCCPLLFGEPHSEMAIQSKDYNALTSMFSKHKN